MSSDVLDLNRNFCAVHIANWQRAVSLVYIEHARVVDEEYRTYNFADWRESYDFRRRAQTEEGRKKRSSVQDG